MRLFYTPAMKSAARPLAAAVFRCRASLPQTITVSSEALSNMQLHYADTARPHNAAYVQRTREMKIMKRHASLLGLGLVFVAGAASAAPLPVQEYTGRGTQVYRCEANGAATSWQLLGPDAHMYDAGGKIVARHFYGPSWQANDGSEIKGKVLVANTSPKGPSNAPWLVLRVVSEQGHGIFAQVRTVTRTDTRGGGTPTQTCTAANEGMNVKVPYSARYFFFSQAKTATGAE
jgi:hypothetical protein